jgi:hypothetical protein
VFVAALIATEKLLPWKAVANRGIALLLVVLGVSVAFWPGRVPGLTLPGSPKAAAAMRSMGIDSSMSQAKPERTKPASRPAQAQMKMNGGR